MKPFARIPASIPRSGIREIMDLAWDVEKTGEVIHLEVGQPDFATPASIVEATCRYVRAGHTKYVGVMVQFKTGLARALFYFKYLAGIRWLFHGQFSAQDHWMVAETDAPPERLYRPDTSLIEWRRLVEEAAGRDRS